MFKLTRFRLIYILPLLALSIVVMFFGIEIQMEKKIIDTSIIPQSRNIELPVPNLERSKKTKLRKVRETFNLHNKSIEKDGRAFPIGPSLDSEGIPVSWVLRINELLNTKIATELSKKLLSSGYSAFIKESAISGVIVNHVYIGPKIAKDKLLKEKESLKKKYGLDSQLIEFRP